MCYPKIVHDEVAAMMLELRRNGENHGVGIFGEEEIPALQVVNAVGINQPVPNYIPLDRNVGERLHRAFGNAYENGAAIDLVFQNVPRSVVLAEQENLNETTDSD